MHKLPSYEELADLYRQGWTYEDLARTFQVSKSTVHNGLRRGALERGEWPLCDETVRRARISRGRAGSHSIELVDSSSIVTTLQLRLGEYPGSCKQYCLENGLRPTTVGDLLNGRKPKITKQLADRLLLALDPQSSS